jgi:transposase/predicted transcriptional regulator
MSKIREIIRLSELPDMSVRKIHRALNVSRPVVDQYIRMARRAGITFSEAEAMDDDELLERIHRTTARGSDPRYAALLKRMPTILTELGKRRRDRLYVTRRLLWEEYRAVYPDGYEYSQFCYHLKMFTEDSEIAMHLNYEPGEKLFADYAGKPPSVTDPKTGISRKVELFVAVFPSSGLIYTEARDTQNTFDTIQGTRHTLEYAGGSPRIIVTDNLKAAIEKPDRYEPDINGAFAAFARYYGCTVIPARVKKPRDKALVEAAVHLVYTRILAPLRKANFATVEELNAAIWEKLDALNDREMQKIGISRRERFDSIEKDNLNVLPAEPYVPRLFTKPITIQKNYHMFFPEDKHYYSVPYRYRGLKATIVFTHNEIEIYHKNMRIASHRRDSRAYHYSTDPDHMPKEHRFYADWSAERFLRWAGSFGPETQQQIRAVLRMREVPEQAFRTCLGILNLPKRYSPERLEAACGRANRIGVSGYKAVKSILDRNLDHEPEQCEQQPDLPIHENIRGREAFAAAVCGGRP